MGIVARKQDLFENILRLRRAGRGVPGNRDISDVRATLEEQLGETVSRRFAARVLGVSHTALDRWVRSGDLPVVYAPSGRVAVPVPALLDLCEEVERTRGAGEPRYVLAPSIKAKRDAARRLNVSDLAEHAAQGGHARAAARSLAYHRAVAARLRRPMVDEARHVLLRWRKQGRIHPRHAARWEQLLGEPLPVIRRAMVDESSDGDDLRQSSPFAGLLSEAERRRIVAEVS